ncbi:MAG: heme biosynthesis HemY N-terminal domain-containing protein [Pseudomonadota bacterium]
MAWTLLKVVIFIGIVVGGVYGVEQLMQADGGIRITVGGTEFTLGPLLSVAGLLLLMVASWLLFKIVGLCVAFVRFILGDSTAINRFFDRRRERKGFDALSEGMMALASGEHKLALTKAAKAERLLNRPELTTLLSAQAAEQSGDTAKATTAYKRLLTNDKTRFVGVRGLMKQQLEAGDTDKAMKLAEKAFALKPKHVETQDVLLKLQAGAHDWTGARKTLGAKMKYGGLPRDVHKRRDAVLALGAARDITDAKQSIEALEMAIEANRQSPDLIPAAVMAAEGYIADQKPKNATRVIKKAWAVQPHPELAAAFAKIKPEETPQERIHRFRVLTGQHKSHPESRMLEAELRIAAEDFPGARNSLGDLADTDPTARSLAIMAAIERGSGADDAVVKGWLARALTASRGPQWVCDSCQKVRASWEPVCSSCGAFDTLSWRVSDDEAMSLAGGAEMLPLIVGQIEGPTEEEIEDAESSEEAETEETVDTVDAEGSGGEVVDVTDNSASVANADAPPAEYIEGEAPLAKDAK